jgi:hypothetical protein
MICDLGTKEKVQMKKIVILAATLVVLVIGTEFDPLTFSAAQEGRSLEERVATLEAQVAALQTQVAKPTARSSTPRPTATAATGSKPIEILDISSADAGIGDGTIYVYVDIRNNTNQLYEFVSIDVTCRDANDRVVATGNGIESNLASGEEVTVTVIVLNAQGCKTINVSVEPMF